MRNIIDQIVGFGIAALMLALTLPLAVALFAILSLCLCAALVIAGKDKIIHTADR